TQAGSSARPRTSARGEKPGEREGASVEVDMATTFGGQRKRSLGPSEDRRKRGTTPGMPSRARFGLTCLATMGANLARNVAHHDTPVAVHNRTASRTTAFLEEHGDEGPISG